MLTELWSIANQPTAPPLLKRFRHRGLFDRGGRAIASSVF